MSFIKSFHPRDWITIGMIAFAMITSYFTVINDMHLMQKDVVQIKGDVQETKGEVRSWSERSRFELDKFKEDTKKEFDYFTSQHREVDKALVEIRKDVEELRRERRGR